jgi:hypothetical protein
MSNFVLLKILLPSLIFKINNFIFKISDPFFLCLHFLNNSSLNLFLIIAVIFIFDKEILNFKHLLMQLKYFQFYIYISLVEHFILLFV